MRFVLALAFGALSLIALSAQEPLAAPEPDPELPQTFSKVRLTLDPGNHVGHLNRVLFSADGAYLITVGNDHAIRLWNARDGEPVRVLRPPGQPGESFPVLSPDGKLLAINIHYPGAQKKDGKMAICLMALADGRIARVLEVPKVSAAGHGRIGSMAFSANGRYLAAASKEKSIWLWDLTGQEPPCEVVTESAVMSLAVSPDGTKLVECRTSHPTMIRDITKPKAIKVRVLEGTNPGAYSFDAVAWSPDGKLIGVASANGLWLLKPDGSLNKQLLKKQIVKSVAFSRDSRRVLAVLHAAGKPAPHVARVFALPAGKPVMSFAPQLDPAARKPCAAISGYPRPDVL